jgi:hypothetical protein
VLVFANIFSFGYEKIFAKFGVGFVFGFHFLFWVLLSDFIRQPSGPFPPKGGSTAPSGGGVTDKISDVFLGGGYEINL